MKEKRKKTVLYNGAWNSDKIVNSNAEGYGAQKGDMKVGEKKEPQFDGDFPITCIMNISKRNTGASTLNALYPTVRLYLKNITLSFILTVVMYLHLHVF